MAKPSFSPEQLQAILEAASNPTKLAEILSTMSKLSKTERDDDRIRRAIIKLGYKDVVLFDPSRPISAQPDVTVLTYRKWLLNCGRKVKPGEKSLPIRGYHVRLFHKSQSEIATKAERVAYHKKQAEYEAKREAQAKAADHAEATV